MTVNLGLITRPPFKPSFFMSQTLSSVPSLTTSQALGKLPEFNPYRIGPSYQRVTPAIRSLTLSLRTANTTALSANHPICPTVPLDTPSVESDSTPMNPNVVTHSEAGSVRNSMNPTSDDDWQVDRPWYIPRLRVGFSLTSYLNRLLSRSE